MSIQDVAEYTGWQVSYLYQLTSKRIIPFYKPRNGKLFFRRSEINEFLFSSKKKTIKQLELDATNFNYKNSI
ncbi:helix-turn-helix domain-containing protein [Chryseobacterium luquanense]|uniref:helix-turn-helix domain-containing protein n=1 Tax=Chryseobacterium luquanense TaxID=2983766 RepID=UPI0035CB827E